jgi:MinD superfamily P-loop ATPase
MPGNSVIINDFLTSADKQGIRLSQVNALLPTIISEIKHQTLYVENIKEKIGDVVQGKISKIALNYFYKLPKHFHADNTCNHCGVCKKVCSFNNIVINDGKPTWGNHCEACLACFHLCPQHAINLDNYTKDFIRYKHPDVSLAELMQNKS